MSKKHFIALAKALTAAAPHMELQAFMTLVHAVADVCAASNRSFCRSTFLNAILSEK
jgi:hypothetical protein